MSGGINTGIILQNLKNCRLLRDLPEESLQKYLLPLGAARDFPAKAAVISPQERVDWFGVVINGRIQILQLFSSGAGSLMDVLLPPQVLGAELICTETRLSPYYAIAARPSRIFAFPETALSQPGFLPEQERRAVWRRLVQMLANENMRKHYRLAILSQRGLRDRVLVYLSMQAARKGTGSFRIPFSRDEMADFLCVNRSALSHELSLMAREGLIRFHKNEFVLLEAGRELCAWPP